METKQNDRRRETIKYRDDDNLMARQKGDSFKEPAKKRQRRGNLNDHNSYHVSMANDLHSNNHNKRSRQDFEDNEGILTIY